MVAYASRLFQFKNISVQRLVLRLASLVFGFTAMVHENILAATASLLAGDTFQQYAIIIGLTVGGMGIGFKLSEKVGDNNIVKNFVWSEVILTAWAGFSILLAYWAYAYLNDGFIWFIRFQALTISILVGLEDALLIRSVEQESGDLKKTISWILSLGHLGSAVAGFTFAGWLLPMFGVFNLALIMGLIDGGMTLLIIVTMRQKIDFRLVSASLLVVVLGLIAALLTADISTRILKQNLYEDPIVAEWVSPYGQKTLTCDRTLSPEGLPHCRLFINGQLQFSSKDERQYHELLIHPAMAITKDRVKNRPINVLIAGGGDGLATRELLKYSEVGKIVVVDLDPQMTNELALQEPIVSYNQGAFKDDRVEIVNADAFIWMRDVNQEEFDLIIVDLVDPDSEMTAKLYSVEYYQLIRNQTLARGGIFVTQSTSPWYSPKTFWTIHLTLAEAFPSVIPFRWAVPSFGDWGWQMASDIPFDATQIEVDNTKTEWLTSDGFQASLFFGKDEYLIHDELQRQKVVSHVDNPAVLFFYQKEWQDWGED